jgi:hypothetical protein
MALNSKKYKIYTIIINKVSAAEVAKDPGPKVANLS